MILMRLISHECLMFSIHIHFVWLITILWSISLKIGSNGVIGLGEEFNSITIHDIGSETLESRHIICPFWVDLLTVDSKGNIYYQTYQRFNVLNLNLYMSQTFPNKPHLNLSFFAQAYFLRCCNRFYFLTRQIS